MINALRAHLAEHGLIAAKGIGNVQELRRIIETAETDIDGLIIERAHLYLEQFEQLSSYISKLEKALKAEADHSDRSKRLMTMPRVAFAPSLSIFRRGRDPATWLGLVPKQNSSRGEARFQVERASDIDCFGRDAGGPVVGEPLNGMRCAMRREPSLDAFDHEIKDHLAGNAHDGSNPTDDLAVVTVQCKGDPDHVTVPAGEFQAIGTPGDIGAQGRDPAIMFARQPATGVADQQQTMLSHTPVDPLRVDGRVAVGSPLALDEHGDPTAVGGRALIGQAVGVSRRRVPGRQDGSGVHAADASRGPSQ